MQMPISFLAVWSSSLVSRRCSPPMLTPPRCFLRLVCDVQLAWLLGNATEELALRSSQTIGGLLNATFGNAVELIISVAALRKGMIKLVQVRLGCARTPGRSRDRPPPLLFC